MESGRHQVCHQGRGASTCINCCKSASRTMSSFIQLPWYSNVFLQEISALNPSQTKGACCLRSPPCCWPPCPAPQSKPQTSPVTLPISQTGPRVLYILFLSDLAIERQLNFPCEQQKCIPLGLAPPASCNSLSNITCVCNNPTFSLSIAGCETTSCSTEETTRTTPPIPRLDPLLTNQNLQRSGN